MLIIELNAHKELSVLLSIKLVSVIDMSEISTPIKLPRSYSTPQIKIRV